MSNSKSPDIDFRLEEFRRQCGRLGSGVSIPHAFDSWVLARQSSNQPITDDELAAVSEAWRPVAERLADTPLGDRPSAIEAFLAGRPNRDAVIQAITDVDPMGPPPPIAPPRQFATCADILNVETGDCWTWDGWLPSSRVVGIAAAEGVGKTRFAMDLNRRVWHGLEWPDGQAMTLRSKSPTIWVAADGQQGELAQALPLLDMPPESIYFPTSPDDPYGGNSLDEMETWEALNEAVRIHKPAFVIVDSLTYATQSDIGEQRTISKLKESLVALAQTHQVIVMLLLHVNKEGQALGRRIRGITRTLLHLEAPNDGQPERLRLWVEKSYARRPPALGVTIGANGNTYDFDPPARSDPSKGGRPPEKLDKAIAFLEVKLARADCKACELVTEWESLKENKGTLLNARKKLESDGRLVVDESGKLHVWRLVH